MAKVKHSVNNLPGAAFLSAGEKVQLLSGNSSRNLTKERLKEWLSFRKGTAKDGSEGWWSEATKAELSQKYKDGCDYMSGRPIGFQITPK